MQRKTKTAGAPALADEATEAVALVVDAVSDVDQSEEATKAEAGEAAAVVDALEQAYPRQAVLRNHSGNSLVEPITGKFLPAGGSEPIDLRDQEHEAAVRANVLALSENTGQLGALTLDFV